MSLSPSSSAPTCVCGSASVDSAFMIACDVCHVWFHGACVGVAESEASHIDKYHCPKCAPLCGPSIDKKEDEPAPKLTPATTASTASASNSAPGGRSSRVSALNPVMGTRVGSGDFLHELRFQRSFPSASDILMELHSGEELRDDDDFGQPIWIRHAEGLGMDVPNEDTCSRIREAVISSVGDVFPRVDVIDVHSQETVNMALEDFLDRYSEESPSSTPLNCLSLEVSDTRLGDRVRAPRFVRSHEWKPARGPSAPTKVMKYCILSMENSYTDFHIDFGGSSVWYHIAKGAKTFYFVAPTPKNLSLFERWQRLQNQKEIFFGDMVDKCYRLELDEKETLIIPTGWIHGVLTTRKSVVFGGNFLNSLNIPLQIKVSELEERLLVAEKYRFPSFIPMHWGAARNITAELDDFNELSKRCPSYLLNGANALLLNLKKWNKKAAAAEDADEDEQQEQKQIMRELGRAIKQAQKNVPVVKPSRESTRTRIKKVNKDFIDTSRVHFAKAELAAAKAESNRLAAAAAAASASDAANSSEEAESKPKVKPKPATKAGASKKTPKQRVPSVPPPVKTETAEDEKPLQPRLPALKLSKKTWMNPTPPSPPKRVIVKPPPPPPSAVVARNVDLTNRDSVRLLLNTKKNTINLLNTELGDALEAFRKDEDLSVPEDVVDRPMVISEDFGKKRKKTKRKSGDDGAKRRKSTEEAASFLDDLSGIAGSRQVYQDNDYVYPSLEHSDDDDEGPAAFLGGGAAAGTLSKSDSLWSPKVRVKKAAGSGGGGSRPVRENAKRKEVELGLKYASERIVQKKSNKQKALKKKKLQAKKVTDASSSSLPSTPVIGATASTLPGLKPAAGSASAASKKFKKGEMTAKQRLGKKLGLKF